MLKLFIWAICWFSILDTIDTICPVFKIGIFPQIGLWIFFWFVLDKVMDMDISPFSRAHNHEPIEFIEWLEQISKRQK